ncbi:hypothetical protein QCI42_02220 [Bacillus fungorum]|uniref:hypothetical protein n=1 Tax=Bacillus fungorum TaxID=2039284 RepID=UPI00339AABFF
MKEETLWKVSLESLKMRSNIFFIITSFSIFLGAIFFFSFGLSIDPFSLGGCYLIEKDMFNILHIVAYI